MAKCGGYIIIVYIGYITSVWGPVKAKLKNYGVKLQPIPGHVIHNSQSVPWA